MRVIKNMLELQKLVLENVHENDSLFEKELRKSKKWLHYKELIVLKKWLLHNFRDNHHGTIKEVLHDIPSA